MSDVVTLAVVFVLAATLYKFRARIFLALRRFEKGWRNFQEIYRPIADSWVVFDNSKGYPRVVETGP